MQGGNLVESCTCSHLHTRTEEKKIHSQHAGDCFFKNIHDLDHAVIFERLGKELGFTMPHDWYKISIEDVEQLVGKKFLRKHYDNSMCKVCHQSTAATLFGLH